MSTTIIIVLVFLVGVFVLPVLQGLLTDEARAWLPHLTRALARAATRRLPFTHRERYQEEWLAELAAYGDRPLTALFRACGLWIGARALRSQLGGETASIRVSMLDRLVAAVMLFLFAPLLVGISAAIRIETPGPVLLRHPRVRQDGHRFDELHFRTVVAEPTSAVWDVGSRGADATPSDDYELVLDSLRRSPGAARAFWRHFQRLEDRFWVYRRVRFCETRVGGVLRIWGLSTLPMLLNVLRGDMPMPYPWRIQGP